MKVNSAALGKQVRDIVNKTPVYDIHTHLYDPGLGPLLLWGIDDLLVYHYLVAEAFRYFDMSYEQFWALGTERQADMIWDALFIEHSPVSESCRGVITTLNLLGLDVKKRDLKKIRKWYAGQKVSKHVDRCMELAGVSRICMTNSPFDEIERPLWEEGFDRDERFVAALRIDPLLLSWSETAPKLNQRGYNVRTDLGGKTLSEVRRFLSDWTTRLNAQYLMVSMPPDWEYPADNECNTLIDEAVVPHCLENGLPFALMPGVRRGVNPQLRLAGDGVGLSDLKSLGNLCDQFPDNKFTATVLARENQHELCVLARKFRNLHIFGCWWFTNIPELINEMTSMRMELLGLSFTPQHSDARVLDQIIYKWNHSKEIIAQVLTNKYAVLAESGWVVGKKEIERDVQQLFGGEFERFCEH